MPQVSIITPCYNAGKVAFTNAEYYYRQHTSSITHSSERATEQILTDLLLLDLVERQYGKQGLTWKRAYAQYVSNTFRIAKIIIKGVQPGPDVLSAIQTGLQQISFADILSLDVSIMKKYAC